MKAPWSQDAFAEAFRFAAEAHNACAQMVPGTDLPYLLHVGLVAQEVMAALAAEPGNEGDLAVRCACLHDTIEDTAVTYDGVVAVFGAAVADGVLALSKSDDAAAGCHDKTERKRLMMEDSLARIRRQPSAVWMVKLADRIANLAPPPRHWPADKRRRYQGEARLILKALGEASPFLAKRLAAKIETYEAHIDAGA